MQRSLLIFLFICSCRAQAPPGPPARLERAKHAPLDQKELPTTDASLVVPDFLARVELALKAAATRPDAPPIQLVSLLLIRAQYFGTLEDYDRALDAAEQLVKLGPKVADAYLLRSSSLAALHRFDAALADLDHAAQLGAAGDAVDSPRASILQAIGRLDEALPIRERMAKQRPQLARIASYAQLLGDLGRVDEAEQQFVEAQYHFDDVSPFPVAWLYFQHGLLEERAGRTSSARELYQAAHDRLPQYAPATAHLAASLAVTGDRNRAIALLRRLVQTSTDPEVVAQLSALSGDGEGGPELAERARARYRVLVAKHPEAFADHAARFWMGTGGDGETALKLARQNLDARRTRDAYQLVIEAALHVNRTQDACAAAEAALALPHPTAALHFRAGEAFGRCSKPERAQAEMAAAAPR